tara:strand:- start:211 stop:417 length:207 start_codon:yes stop_codon:yes gene_type:complete
MTIAQLAHQDSTELAVALLGFDAWLDSTAPSSDEWDKILHDMHVADGARERKDNTEFSMPTAAELRSW